MKLGRNDPCHCGSGRKYKQCCQASDVAKEAGAPGATPSGGRLARHVALAAAEESRWEADAVPLPIGFDDGVSHRPVAVLVTAGEFVVGHQIRDRIGGEAEDVAEAIERGVVRAASEVGSFPEDVAVRFPELVEALQARLGPRGIRVRHEPVLPNLEPAARELISHIVGEHLWPPMAMADSWATWRLPAALIRELFDASAAFWRRAPWKILANRQAPIVTLPSGAIWSAAVMGNGGEHFGLILYSDPEDHIRALVGDDAFRMIGSLEGRMLSLGLDPESDLPPPMIREARLSGWKTASPRAFPFLMTFNTPGGGVSRANAEALIALLRAIPDFADAHAEHFLLEQRSEVPGPPIEWRHPATGTVFHYDLEDIDERVERLELAEGPELGPDLDLDLQGIFDAVVEAVGAGADEATVMAEVDRRLRAAVPDYNDRPQRELGGLSPAAIHGLLNADWLDPEGPIRLNRQLPLEVLGRSDLFTNVRAVMRYAYDRDGLAATEAGNLAVAVVDALIDRMRPEGMAMEIRSVSKRVIEIDAWPLHLIRVLLELAGLLERPKRRFLLTPEGEKLLPDDSAGELYALLFETHFRRFNLAYSGLGPDWPGLQATVAFSLHRLVEEARMWRTAEDLLPQVVLPPVLDEGPRPSRIDIRPSLFETRILGPLEELGLLERREGSARKGSLQPADRYRTTDLYGKFLRFEL